MTRPTRYWTDLGRDWHGRLPPSLRLRIEWTQDGVTYTSCGTYNTRDHALTWDFGDEPPDGVHTDALACAFDAGEGIDTTLAEYSGRETSEQMWTAVDAQFLAEAV